MTYEHPALTAAALQGMPATNMIGGFEQTETPHQRHQRLQAEAERRATLQKIDLLPEVKRHADRIAAASSALEDSETLGDFEKHEAARRELFEARRDFRQARLDALKASIAEQSKGIEEQNAELAEAEPVWRELADTILAKKMALDEELAAAHHRMRLGHKRRDAFANEKHKLQQALWGLEKEGK